MYDACTSDDPEAGASNASNGGASDASNGGASDASKGGASDASKGGASDASNGGASADGISVTVCLCTHNRPAYVRHCLAGLRRQTVGPARFDVVVVDSGSAAGPRAGLAGIVAAPPGARL